MSNSNYSLTKALLLHKLQYRSSQRSKPQVKSSNSTTSNLPALSIQNSRTAAKLCIDEEVEAPQPPKSRKYTKIQNRQCSVPIVDKKFVFRKSSISKAPEKKMGNLMLNTLACYFEYRPISLTNVLGKRDDYMVGLRIKKRELQSVPLNPLEVKHRLEQFYERDYRNKGKSHFNIITSQQLRSMKFNKQQRSFHSHKKKKHRDQDDVVQEEENEETTQISDFPTWKRKNGVGHHQKVFIVKGGYEYLRKSLLDRGWVENDDVWSPFFDLKWTTKIYDINFNQLNPDQMVNHFNYNEGLISKFGLAQSLRILAIRQRVDVNRFFPRCFDLTIQGEFQDFVENFKFTFAQSILNRYLVDSNRYKGLQLKVRLAIKAIERRLLTFKQKVDVINTGNFYFITSAEWAVLTQIDERSYRFIQSLLRKRQIG